MLVRPLFQGLFRPFLRFLPLIVLTLPAVELLLDMVLYRRWGDSFVWYLGGAALAGVWLLLRAKETFGAALRGLAGGGRQSLAASLWVLLAGARAFVAGLLLLFPGLLSDALALLVLWLPGRVIDGRVGTPANAANDSVIEGEFHEVREDPIRLR